jgi:hypothetical protein
VHGGPPGPPLFLSTFRRWRCAADIFLLPLDFEIMNCNYLIVIKSFLLHNCNIQKVHNSNKNRPDFEKSGLMRCVVRRFVFLFSIGIFPVRLVERDLFPNKATAYLSIKITFMQHKTAHHTFQCNTPLFFPTRRNCAIRFARDGLGVLTAV